MERIPPFKASELEAACKVLADTASGLKGDEIGYILADMNVLDPDAGMTKWKRLFNALAGAQNKHQVGNHLVMFINRAMDPVRYASAQELFALRRDGLNVVLALCGYRVRDDGKVAHATRESTLAGAQARAGRLKSLLEARTTHSEVFKYCRAELLQDNYFHAVFEAIKGLGQRLRDMSGLKTDGAELVNTALSTKSPLVALNSLSTETEISEQKGIANLLLGVFGAVRNPAAHAPRTEWSMPEQDAVDMFALVSYLHRKLDTASVSIDGTARP
ncbi:TIGR02391 family protein [Stenotrophomonas maltophilia]|uniref:TIGR02391 family protein n=1 Tax=Stenotrophomonas maltophilia TaxID=40324 RepID=UPI002A9A0578|nr:TIGR02391 family protein [Stenotrophomonas maltophilia]MDZ5840519.1 TIGR02391 family protein [Stenotrophomonas maltophilia]HDS1556796.1 TIGR02391 family protein [Stenotrophomonas maltophilia]HEL5052634.1 TIGR02391 family protein [Stenotrophomonas maltophilia]